MSSTDFSTFFAGLLSTAPSILICIIGVIIILDRWRSLGNAALPACLGFAGLVVVGLLQPLVSSFLPPLLLKIAGSAAGIRSAYGVVNLLFSLLRAAAYFLLILGVIRGRKPPEAP